jgi:hypothetical protein
VVVVDNVVVVVVFVVVDGVAEVSICVVVDVDVEEAFVIFVTLMVVVVCTSDMEGPM